ncbi:MAG: hybrid sensor histidine kinase/response regulator [Gammaproteobacteria bacterium]|nr:hybrid sensor histidine kinase/response regulator [Gammaproteobacteria bacterium]
MIAQLHNHSRYSILFVDDEEKSLKYFKQAYSRHFNVLTASCPDEAIKLLNRSSENIGVLITDKRMPEKSGIELLEWAKKQKPEIVRLLTTAYSDNKDTIEAINKGYIFRYIPKPWQIETLLTDLRSAMDLYMQNKLESTRADKSARSSATLAAYFVSELKSPLAKIDNLASELQSDLSLLIDGSEKTLHSKPLENAEKKLTTLSHTPVAIESNVQIAKTMIDSLLSNYRRGYISAEDVAPFSIRDCINGALSQYPFDKNFRKRVYFYPDLDFIISGIEDLVKFALLNLLNNAIYAISEDNTGEILIQLETGKQCHYLYFKDTGKGIPANVLPRIFDDYFTTKENNKGLGLSFCKKIMKELGGDIHCHTQKNFYTEFTLSFPKTTTLSKNKQETQH